MKAAIKEYLVGSFLALLGALTSIPPTFSIKLSFILAGLFLAITGFLKPWDD